MKSWYGKRKVDQCKSHILFSIIYIFNKYNISISSQQYSSHKIIILISSNTFTIDRFKLTFDKQVFGQNNLYPGKTLVQVCFASAIIEGFGCYFYHHCHHLWKTTGMIPIHTLFLGVSIVCLSLSTLCSVLYRRRMGRRRRR